MYKFFLVIPALLFPVQAYAYIGPGMSGGLVATTLGMVAAFFLAILGVIYYPIKRIIKKWKNRKK